MWDEGSCNVPARRGSFGVIIATGRSSTVLNVWHIPLPVTQVRVARIRRISRYRWPLLITLAVSVTAAFSLSPLVDIARPRAAVPAVLSTPFWYVLVAPISNILDALTLLTPSQYWATFALCTIVFFGATALKITNGGRGFRFVGFLRSVFLFVGGTVALVGVMLLAPRPMASLSLADPDLVAVDFHSHTSASHDGRAGFDSERNREWHRSAGFDVAYITDHRTFDGALAGEVNNPLTAGQGTMLLPGVELHDVGEHPILIGVDPRRMKITSPDWQGATVEADGGPVPPILILSMPGNLARVPSDELTGAVRVAAVEGADGSPRGMAQTANERITINALAARLGLAVVSGSDNHGWGRTASAWSVLRIPGWRDMTAGALDVAIRRTIISRKRGSADVFARRTLGPASGKLEIALAGVGVGVMVLRTMNFGDRVSWAGWSWAIALWSLVRARQNRKRLRLLVRRNVKVRVPPPVIEVAAMEAAS